ncbi:hypothetical protein TUBRATIS_11540 [Tubulinosema ratisbonensis]|uniref:Uncharacterized protein n=1 Tax=Tubulinosema ratisbonensis TaxID=291195 RepID=A0A437AMH2_9MICR|nr:hypothetical protein TUBRATIS_11540 [Tubulinosema ratisbonensis]
MKSFIIKLILVLTLLLIIAYILKRLLRQKLTKEEVKEYLKFCLDSLKTELKQTLVKTEYVGLNNLLIQYFNRKDLIKLYKVVDYLRAKYSIQINKDFTPPGLIMYYLIREIVKEQLNLDYSSGFKFDSDTFYKLHKIAPFVKKYCVIVKLNDNTYFTDILIGKYKFNLLRSVLTSFDKFINMTDYKLTSKNNIILPKYVINLFKYCDKKYNIDFSLVNTQSFIILQDGNEYQLNKMVVLEKSYWFSEYKLKNESEIRSFCTLFNQRNLYDYGFCSFLVLKRID